MASRRYRAKNSLNSNISQVNARISQISKRPAPRKIAEGSITSAQIREATITAANLDAGSVTGDKLAADAVKTGNIVDSAITTEKINNLSVTTEKLAANAINLASTSVVTGTLPVSKGGTGAVSFTAGFLKASGNTAFTTSSIQASDIPNLNANKITEGTFTENLIPTLSATKIPELSANKITSDTFNADRIPSLNGQEKINSKTIGGSHPDYTGINNIADNSIGALNIGPQAVDTSELADGAVTAAKIANGAVGNDQLANDSVTLAKIPAATELAIVSNNINAGVGINIGTGNVVGVSADFGSTSTQIARGNHQHNVTVSGAAQTVTTTVPITSSLKSKKDISTHTPINIKNLLNLEAKSFRYKRPERNYHEVYNKDLMYGYILEELVELGFTEPVAYSKEGEPEKLDYGLMSMLVLELVKVQQTEIDYLKEEIEKLKDNK